MAFELVNTIDKAWRTVEESDFLSCKTVCLYNDDLYSWTEALDIAYGKMHPACRLPGSLKEGITRAPQPVQGQERRAPLQKHSSRSR